MYHVILAGGFGSRFWPESRRDNPKQLLKIMGQDSMIKMTVNRLKKISSPENILIVASELLTKKFIAELPEIPLNNFIIEPDGKNTAPAIGLAALHVYDRNPQGIMGIYPADHLILNENEFQIIIEKAHKFAEKSSSLITLGIKPTFPATGYGYIQFDKKSNFDGDIYKVKTFAEKPPIESAERFFNSGEFLWNSGMFIWKAEVILLEMKTYMPELHESLDAIFDSIHSGNYDIVLDREWEIIQSQSIDYGIMEKANNVYTLISDFGWNDMGSWQSIYDVFEKDKNGMVIRGDVFSQDSKNSVVFSNNKFTAVIGADDLVIINTDDATLVMNKEHAQNVKDIVTHLNNSGKDEYL
tara:strand:- start:678 stop:1742 length:1065 start_codon:yes stop_codon:yes gene_type:complete